MSKHIVDMPVTCPICRKDNNRTWRTKEGNRMVRYCVKCGYIIEDKPVQSYRAPSPHTLPKQERI